MSTDNDIAQAKSAKKRAEVEARLSGEETTAEEVEVEEDTENDPDLDTEETESS